ncbi:MAG: DUF4123 domain-containing protein [Bryobacteraceae bacterium]|nr:DUF4123 domain-containing protein [Bryobacteraceae bacterium]
MLATITIDAGPRAGESLKLRSGRSVTIGRGAKAEFQITDDSFLSSLHCLLEFRGPSLWVRDLGSSNGTLVNGRLVAECRLAGGDRIDVGRTKLVVSISGDGAPAGELKQAVLRVLRAQPGLFAILDAARDPMLLGKVRAFGEEFDSLFEGPHAGALVDFAPYLCPLPPEGRLLAELVDSGWGNAWGVFLTCDETFAALRRHLRRFLTVKTEDCEKLYFRFYDPRVLRIYLPTCNSAETRLFFGPIGSYLVEDRDPGRVIRFTPGADGVTREVIAADGDGGS